MNYVPFFIVLIHSDPFRLGALIWRIQITLGVLRALLVLGYGPVARIISPLLENVICDLYLQSVWLSLFPMFVLRFFINTLTIPVRVIIAIYSKTCREGVSAPPFLHVGVLRLIAPMYFDLLILIFDVFFFRIGPHVVVVQEVEVSLHFG